MLAHLDLTVLLILEAVIISLSQTSDIPIQKIPLTPNEASFIESKDVLLQMLEKKLKEIKDSKKLKHGNSDVLPKNVDFNLKSNGIGAVGEADLILRYGKDGQGSVNLTAEGISNVGKVQLLVGTGDNGLRIPGLSNLFSGSSIRSGDKNDENQVQLVGQNDINFGFRRQTNISSVSSDDKANRTIEHAEVMKDDKNKVDIEEKSKAEEQKNVTTATSDGANNVLATGDNVLTIPKVTGGNTATNAASNSSPVVNSGPAIKSDTVSGNNVASNGESVNKIK